MINNYQEAKCTCTGTSTMSRMSTQNYGIGVAKDLVPYEKPALIEVSLAYNVFLCASDVWGYPTETEEENDF